MFSDLLEEQIVLARQKAEIVALLSEHSVPAEEIDQVLPVLLEDPEAINELFGALGKASSWLGSKLSSAGSKMTNYSNKKALGREQRKAKLSHRKAAKAYGKALKSGSEGERKAALVNLTTQRNNSRLTRGKSFKLGVKRKGGKEYHMEPTNKNIYRRLGEALLVKAGVDLNEAVNPWAVCHASTGKAKSEKFERCVHDVKNKEGLKYSKKTHKLTKKNK